MGGLARRFGPEYSDSQSAVRPGAGWAGEIAQSWLRAGADSGMPLDPRTWGTDPPAGSFPACMAVVAAREQGPAAAMSVLRRLREAFFCERRHLDSGEAVLSAVEGLESSVLNRDRFRVDLASTAILENFGLDLELVRSVPEEATGMAFETEGHRRIAFPSLQFLPSGESWGAGLREELPALWGPSSYEDCREAAIAAGAKPVNSGPLEPLAAIQRFGRLATAEIEALAARPRPLVEAELWRLAAEWRLRPVPVLTGTFWQLT